jgi:hypothetical protein
MPARRRMAKILARKASRQKFLPETTGQRFLPENRSAEMPARELEACRIDLTFEVMMGRLSGLRGAGGLGGVRGVEVERMRLLGEVRMLIALVNLELGGHLAAELGLGKHALDRLLDDGFGTAGKQLDEALFTQAAGKAGVAAIHLLVALHAGEDDLLGVDHDDVIAHVDVGRVERIELAGEDGGGGGGEASEGLAGGVDDEPLALDVFAAGDRGGLVQVTHDAMYSLVLLSSVKGSVMHEDGYDNLRNADAFRASAGDFKSLAMGFPGEWAKANTAEGDRMPGTNPLRQR